MTAIFKSATLAALALAMLVGACSPSEAPEGSTAPSGTSAPAEQAPSEGQAPSEEQTTLAGDIVVDGSSTVYPIAAAAAEEFGIANRDVRVSVGVSGTGGGFKSFCAGETDMSNASRPIKAEEISACEAAGVEFIEIPVAYDGLAVVVNPENDWAECLTVDELKMIWEPAAQGTVKNWSQVRDGFPDAPLVLLGAGTDSGTFDYFTEAVVGEAKASRGDYQATEDDNVTVTGVSGDVNSMGYLGYAYVIENEGKMRAISVDDGSGTCVAPSFETVADATYQPLSRPLFIYVNAEAATRPEIAGFVEYLLSPEFTPLIQTPQVGYVALTPELYAAGLERFTNMTTGSLWAEGEGVGATLDRYLDH